MPKDVRELWDFPVVRLLIAQLACLVVSTIVFHRFVAFCSDWYFIFYLSSFNLLASLTVAWILRDNPNSQAVSGHFWTDFSIAHDQISKSSVLGLPFSLPLEKFFDADQIPRVLPAILLGFVISVWLHYTWCLIRCLPAKRKVQFAVILVPMYIHFAVFSLAYHRVELFRPHAPDLGRHSDAVQILQIVVLILGGGPFLWSIVFLHRTHRVKVSVSEYSYPGRWLCSNAITVLFGISWCVLGHGISNQIRYSEAKSLIDEGDVRQAVTRIVGHLPEQYPVVLGLPPNLATDDGETTIDLFIEARTNFPGSWVEAVYLRKFVSYLGIPTYLNPKFFLMDPGRRKRIERDVAAISLFTKAEIQEHLSGFQGHLRNLLECHLNELEPVEIAEIQKWLKRYD